MAPKAGAQQGNTTRVCTHTLFPLSTIICLLNMMTTCEQTRHSHVVFLYSTSSSRSFCHDMFPAPSGLFPLTYSIFLFSFSLFSLGSPCLFVTYTHAPPHYPPLHPRSSCLPSSLQLSLCCQTTLSLLILSFIAKRKLRLVVHRGVQDRGPD